MNEMWATVVMDSDVAAEVERLQQQGMGVGKALNMLARLGIAARNGSPRARYRHRTAHLGLTVDVTKVADVLDVLDTDR
ncbi:CopG family transcriptional regulator [Mycolicibacter sp. MYC123]|uniref:CopG family transcriptional regulator n=1 Tax=[Mycobacterium] zoologicum TaxID=2872311 RepID=A0ABU5YKC6_9MYCO|nr:MULTISPECIES: CopG family transcriptional regulator [unclassified Mycolicibacter]MEB3050508.1 CopG family transcriptional regulator [Mycolicibacter sp. MYC123]MEB3063016.1 CopG family transcriptional regulator [Mycolicibacter sp. MYC101]